MIVRVKNVKIRPYSLQPQATSHTAAQKPKVWHKSFAHKE